VKPEGDVRLPELLLRDISLGSPREAPTLNLFLP
jgi:hypothetical protein